MRATGMRHTAANLRYPTQAVQVEKQRAKHIKYTAASDFENCLLMAEIMRAEDKNSRAAQMLENAAWLVRRAEKQRHLATVAKPVNRPKRPKKTFVRGAKE